MNTLATAAGLSFAYLRDRLFATSLNMLLLSLGIATVVALTLVLSQAEERMEKDAAGIDLVIGAKGSPMQLVLSSVFQVDVPTGNVKVGDAAPIIAEPMVKRAIPLALGDSFRGYRIVGTNPDYAALYGASPAQGAFWKQPMEAVLGAEVARASGLGLGDRFTGSHGLTESGGSHGEHPFTVVGILKPTGSVIDRIVLTSVASVWQVHDHDADEHHHEGIDHAHDADMEVTAYLIQYASPLAAVSFPRMVNASSTMQAASPAMESARLFQLVGVGVTALKALAGVMVLAAALGIFIGLTVALDERRGDLALLRVLGAAPSMVFLTTLLQGLWLGVTGVILGLLLGHAGAEWVGARYAESQRVALGGWVWVREEWWIVLTALCLALSAALIPAWRAYREAAPALLARRH